MSVCARKVLRPAISTQASLVFLCFQPNAGMVSKFKVAIMCSPPDLSIPEIKPLTLENSKLRFKIMQHTTINHKIKIPEGFAHNSQNSISKVN
jgi:hypothetical protein